MLGMLIIMYSGKLVFSLLFLLLHNPLAREEEARKELTYSVSIMILVLTQALCSFDLHNNPTNKQCLLQLTDDEPNPEMEYLAEGPSAA